MRHAGMFSDMASRYKEIAATPRAFGNGDMGDMHVRNGPCRSRSGKVPHRPWRPMRIRRSIPVPPGDGLPRGRPEPPPPGARLGKNQCSGRSCTLPAGPVRVPVKPCPRPDVREEGDGVPLGPSSIRTGYAVREPPSGNRPGCGPSRRTVSVPIGGRRLADAGGGSADGPDAAEGGNAGSRDVPKPAMPKPSMWGGR
jgi:hypothetical protein